MTEVLRALPYEDEPEEEIGTLYPADASHYPSEGAPKQKSVSFTSSTSDLDDIHRDRELKREEAKKERKAKREEREAKRNMTLPVFPVIIKPPPIVEKEIIPVVIPSPVVEKEIPVAEAPIVHSEPVVPISAAPVEGDPKIMFEPVKTDPSKMSTLAVIPKQKTGRTISTWVPDFPEISRIIPAPFISANYLFEVNPSAPATPEQQQPRGACLLFNEGVRPSTLASIGDVISFRPGVYSNVILKTGVHYRACGKVFLQNARVEKNDGPPLSVDGITFTDKNLLLVHTDARFNNCFFISEDDKKEVVAMEVNADVELNHCTFETRSKLYLTTIVIRSGKLTAINCEFHLEDGAEGNASVFALYSKQSHLVAMSNRVYHKDKGNKFTFIRSLHGERGQIFAIANLVTAINWNANKKSNFTNGSPDVGLNSYHMEPSHGWESIPWQPLRTKIRSVEGKVQLEADDHTILVGPHQASEITLPVASGSFEVGQNIRILNDSPQTTLHVPPGHTLGSSKKTSMSLPIGKFELQNKGTCWILF